jgi:hypothetical protein
MTLEAFNQLQKKLESNELYQKSKSLHKSLQYRLFSDSATGKPVDGQQLRMEDDSLLVDGMDGFDEKRAKLVIYNFKEGVLHSENNEPAVQYPGHWEYWNHGLITKVVADGGDTEEYWENGVPVRIETDLAVSRMKGESV